MVDTKTAGERLRERCKREVAAINRIETPRFTFPPNPSVSWRVWGDTFKGASALDIKMTIREWSEDEQNA